MKIYSDRTMSQNEIIIFKIIQVTKIDPKKTKIDPKMTKI